MVRNAGKGIHSVEVCADSVHLKKMYNKPLHILDEVPDCSRAS